MPACLVFPVVLASPDPKEMQGSPASPDHQEMLGPPAHPDWPCRGPKATPEVLEPQGEEVHLVPRVREARLGAEG